MVPGEQSRNIRPNFITESSETPEERFPLIIINSRKKSFPPKAGSSCPSVFSSCSSTSNSLTLPPHKGETPISAPSTLRGSKEIQTGSRLTALVCTLNKQELPPLRALSLPKGGCTSLFFLPLLSCPAQTLHKSLDSPRHETHRMRMPGVSAPHLLEPHPSCCVSSCCPWESQAPAAVGL